MLVTVNMCYMGVWFRLLICMCGVCEHVGTEGCQYVSGL